MINAPRLINNRFTTLLPNTLFSDLQLDKILSSQAIAVLQHPCEPGEIVNGMEIDSLPRLLGDLESAL